MIGSILLALLLGAAAPGEPPSTPYLDRRAEPMEYPGPGRDDPAPEGLTEVRIGWFGPSDPADPDTGDFWAGALLAVEEINKEGGVSGLPVRLVPGWSESPWAGGVNRVVRMVYEDQVLGDRRIHRRGGHPPRRAGGGQGPRPAGEPGEHRQDGELRRRPLDVHAPPGRRRPGDGPGRVDLAAARRPPRHARYPPPTMTPARPRSSSAPPSPAPGSPSPPTSSARPTPPMRQEWRIGPFPRRSHSARRSRRRGGDSRLAPSFGPDRVGAPGSRLPRSDPRRIEPGPARLSRDGGGRRGGDLASPPRFRRGRHLPSRSRSRRPALDAIRGGFASRHSREPDFTAGAAYDAVRLTVEAARRAGLNRARILDTLRAALPVARRHRRDPLRQPRPQSPPRPPRHDPPREGRPHGLSPARAAPVPAAGATSPTHTP